MDTPKTMPERYAMDMSLTLTVTQDCYGHSKDPVTKDMLLTLQTLSQKICDMYRNSKDIVTKDMLLALLRPCNKICYAHIKHPVARYAMDTSKTPSQNICYGHHKNPVTKDMLRTFQDPITTDMLFTNDNL